MTQEESFSFRQEIADSTVLVIFGASGDLSRRKLMPALYHLSRDDLLPSNFKVFGMGRRIQLGEEFAQHMQKRVMQYCSHKMEDRFWTPIAQRMESIQADYQNPETFDLLKDRISEVEKIWNREANKLFYFATSPSHFQILVEGLSRVNLNKSTDNSWSRIIVEKPFGLNLIAADALNSAITKHFRESQVFRIDHFLGKEAIQNILIFRVSNLMFQPVWNREYIDNVQITSSETIGVEGRVDFFEQTGAMLDMIQSHLLQTLAFLTMEHPKSLNPEEIRDEKVILLKSIRRYNPDEALNYVVRGQYSEGVVNSEFVKGYREEDGVAKKSLVETFSSVKLYIDNFRWRGVPFYLRTGKRMPRRKTEIFIQLKPPETKMIPTIFSQKQQPIPNAISMEIQPRAGVDITIGWKPAGLLTDVEPTSLNIGGKAEIKEPKAYERLLVDAIRGDSTLFIRFDEIREMFQVVEPFMKAFKIENEKIKKGELPDPFPNYAAGTPGPKAAFEFLKRDKRQWKEL
jgi:glucose-6-phosphate 1-dehydrogenase